MCCSLCLMKPGFLICPEALSQRAGGRVTTGKRTEQKLFLFSASWIGIPAGLPKSSTVLGIMRYGEQCRHPHSTKSPRLSSSMMKKPTFQQEMSPPGRNPGGSLECDTVVFVFLNYLFKLCQHTFNFITCNFIIQSILSNDCPVLVAVI